MSYEEDKPGDWWDDPLHDAEGAHGAVFLALAVILGGLGILVQLWLRHPTHLAETIIDAEIVPRHPELGGRIASKAWRQEMIGTTALGFLAPTLIAFIVAAIWHRFG